MNDKFHGKELRVFGVRQNLIGDQIMALPVLAWLRKMYPDCYIYWSISRKIAQAAPLYLNHDFIDQICVTDCEEGLGPRDLEIIKKCQIAFNTMPSHPDGDRAWVNDYNIYEETWRMAGLPISEYRGLTPYEQRPHLTQWFNAERQTKGTIALYPCSAYGVKQAWHSRFPTRDWYVKLIHRLTAEGYGVIQFGHPNDYADCGGSLSRSTRAGDSRHLEFFSQIKLALGCDLAIVTDSGAGLVLGAYESIPTISLLTPHTPGHVRNFEAFGMNSPLNKNFVGVDSADEISIDEVVQAVKDRVSL